MSLPSPKKPTHPEITQQHQELNTLIELLRSTLARTSRDRDALQDVIRDLAELVTVHFEHEEQGGYFSEAVKRAPRLLGHSQELCLQHEALSEQILTLNSLARSGVESPAWWRQMEIDTERFIDAMLAHETSEKELLQKAYADDLGDGD